MTLTLETAELAVGKYGKIYDIGDEGDILDDYSMAREEAEDISEYDPNFKPCIAVTTAREALEAAWDAAHPVPETVTTIPPGTPLIAHDYEGITFTSEGYDFSLEIDKDSETKLRTLTPLPEPKPEPWETARFCYADGEIFKRRQGHEGPYWVAHGDLVPYHRDLIAGRNPKPLHIEGETE